jgi:hypothetical protein
LRKIAGETLPSLPAPGPFKFKPSPTLTADLQTKLTKALSNYQTYLATLGFDPKPTAEKIGIRVDENLRDNVYFDGEEIVLGLNLASDPEYALSEYTWYVLKQSNPPAFEALFNNPRVQLSGLGQGLKFYFVCSYGNDPYVGKSFYSLIGGVNGQNRPYLFNLKDLKTFEKDSGPDATEEHHLGEIWGGAFWEIREKLGQHKTDKLILTAWKRLDAAKIEPKNAEFFINALLDANKEPESGRIR